MLIYSVCSNWCIVVVLWHVISFRCYWIHQSMLLWGKGGVWQIRDASVGLIGVKYCIELSS